MKKLIVALSLVSLAGVSNAACYGSGNSYTCTDQSGNRYAVQKYGNTTTVKGTNFRTGSNWSARSTDYGTSTVTRGTTNGKSWNKTDTPYRSYGTDSNGRYFNYNR